jgi:ATP-dependent exoDNAse (exonuclease V) beta subunit
MAALQHPVVRSAAVSDQVRREAPVVLKLAEGHLAEGVVDLAFFEAETKEWVVVDFKTDLSLEPKLPEYLSQLRLYMRAISRATGKPARGVLLGV